MKSKKVFAVILAVALTISMLPTLAFASTTNTVEKTYAVAAETDMPEVTLLLEVTNNTGITAEDVVKFRVSLENATFKNGNETDLEVKAIQKDGTSTPVTPTVNSVSDSAMVVTLPNVAVNKGGYIQFTLKDKHITSGEEAGDVKISIDGLDSKITSGTYTVATVSSDVTVAKVSGDPKTYPRQNVIDAKAIEINETTVNAITANQIVKFSLPKGFTWLDSTVVKGDMLTTAIDDTGNYEASLERLSPGKAFIDGRNLYVYLNVDDQNYRQTLVIEPKFNITKDADMGDVTVGISSYRVSDGNAVADADGLVIAKYGDEAVTVTTVDEEDLPEVVAGYLADKNGKRFIVEVTVEESVAKSLSSGRYVDFDFNDEIQVVTDESIQWKVNKTAKANVDGFLDIDATAEDDRSEFTVTVPKHVGLDAWKDEATNKVTFYIPVTAKANYTGDISLTVKGAKAGVEETTLVVGKVIAPITVDTQITKIVNGAQKQAVANITIKENVPGYLDVNKDIVLGVDTLGLLNGFVFDGATFKVTAGDLEIGKTTITNGKITIPVKDSSTKVSTIEITGITASLSRLLPFGTYELGVGGNALVKNSEYNDDDFDVDTVTANYVELTTAADTEINFDAKFVIGSTKYTVDGVEQTMDAAPYIDSHNRTLVPIRYAAYALGVKEADITYAGKTATINGAKTVVSITTGNNTIVTSNGNITMDTVAVNKDGRIYVPVRFIANALGAQVAWDNATRTVILF